MKTHGGYRNLKSYQTTTLAYDLTVKFCKIYMTYGSNQSYRTTDQMIQAANCIICLIHQANYLLDKQLSALEENFIKDGGYTENLFKKRIEKKYEI
jgi:four helix bundle suffix protein